MKVHMITPYSVDKNLGRAYNEAMRLVGDDDWVCLLDYDVLLLTPDAGAIIHRYAEAADPDWLLTCYTNRISPLSVDQLLNGRLSHHSDLKTHIRLAVAQRDQLYKLTPMFGHLSGFLMLLKKSLWSQDGMQFTEDLKCLGVDTDYRERLRRHDKQLVRMDGLYVWHSYRLLEGITYKNHLT